MKYTDEKQVLEALKVDSWKKLTKEKYLKYIAIVPDVSEEVRLKVLEKLPDCLAFTKDLVETMKAQQENVANHNTTITTSIIQSLNAIQKSLDSMANKPDLTFEERKYFCDQQMEIARIYLSLDKTNKEFLQKLWKGVTVFGVAVLVFVATLVGVKFFGGNSEDEAV